MKANTQEQAFASEVTVLDLCPTCGSPMGTEGPGHDLVHFCLSESCGNRWRWCEASGHEDYFPEDAHRHDDMEHLCHECTVRYRRTGGI